MSPRLLLVACLGILLSGCGVASSRQVASNDLDPRDLDEYHLHRLDGTQSCAKVRMCNEAVTTTEGEAAVARLGVNPDYESWPEGAIP